ncbi:MAG: hypothetical protein A4S09_01355 [Proteobacteria bacterium SG_bin7]|nr:MAG: hypothetical protein A4S09_01355 [Proteobacteria bacterium SG_bin7]
MGKIVLVLFTLFTSTGRSTVYFSSSEESYNTDSPMPNPPYNFSGSSNTLSRRGNVRASPLLNYGDKAFEWQTSGNASETDLWNVVNVPNIPSGGTLYYGMLFKAIRINGVNVWATPNGNDEAFDKAFELLGSHYRWTVNFGIRSQRGPANTWSLFVGCPCYHGYGHFHGIPGSSPCQSTSGPPATPLLEEYDSMWMNFNNYGRGQTGSMYPGNYYPLEYDRWYALVLKVTFANATGGNGEVSFWINGTQVMRYLGIKTSGSATPLHEGIDMFGTYRQPVYDGRAHKRQVKRITLASTVQDMQNAGLMADPQSTTPIPPVQVPKTPQNLRIDH